MRTRSARSSAAEGTRSRRPRPTLRGRFGWPRSCSSRTRRTWRAASACCACTGRALRRGRARIARARRAARGAAAWPQSIRGIKSACSWRAGCKARLTRASMRWSRCPRSIRCRWCGAARWPRRTPTRSGADLARREFERLAVNDFEDLPFDHNWLSCHLYLSAMSRTSGPRARRDRVSRATAVRRSLHPARTPIDVRRARCPIRSRAWRPRSSCGTKPKPRTNRPSQRNRRVRGEGLAALCQVRVRGVAVEPRIRRRPAQGAAAGSMPRSPRPARCGLGEITQRAARLPDGPGGRTRHESAHAILSKS